MKTFPSNRLVSGGLRPLRKAVILALAGMLAALPAHAASVINSVHNLTASGPGTIKSAGGKDACVFCHTSHHATIATPLWNHSLSTVSNYVVYASARMTSLSITIPQPNGSSRLCLSCHDGTVALGSLGGYTVTNMQNGVTTMPAGNINNLGTDLSADHPISFVYDSALASRDAAIIDPAHLSTKLVRTDSQSRLQCTACHDPHNDQYGSFLVMDNTGSALCLVCHNPGSWGTSAHAVSSAVVPAALASAISAKVTSRVVSSKKVVANTVATLGCASCHVSHKAGTKQHLLMNAVLEQNCLDCHNGGTTASKNVAADFQKASIHPITLNSEAHSSVEDPVNPSERHVVCADCHNPHAAKKAAAVAPNVGGPLTGVTGVAAAGGVIKPALREYEVCFRCHADSVARGPATVSRQYIQTNTRLQFATGNQSFHPVESAGKNVSGVPSLIAPWTTASVTYCTDCHNSDQSPAAGGSGPNGPHGSIYRPILERNLVLTDNEAESGAAYALCYKCHSRTSLLGNQSFSFHRQHVVNDQTACTTCHDSHGVANGAHLINFNTTYVTPSSNGRMEYLSTGTYSGVCSLTCHGKDHAAVRYNRFGKLP